MNDNPLLSPQREKAGSTTFAKYGYQYHWALYKVLEEHGERNEYAVFLELHEDVVLSNSLDKDKAQFEFNQVKTNKNKFTERSLTKATKTKRSVLGKLIDSCINKDYSHAISNINLISTNGFSLSLKKPDLDLEVIQISDISETSFEEIEKKLVDEINCEGLPKNLQFIIPSLPEKQYQNAVVGEISSLIKKLYPSSNCDSVDIYRSLIDELQRKGMDSFDYKNWNDALKNKSLTSVTVNKVLNSFTSQKNESDIQSGFNDIASELKLNTIQKRKLKKTFNRYRNRRIGARNSTQLNTTKKIKKLIDDNIDDCDDSIEKLVSIVKVNLDQNIRNQFPNENDLSGAIICEYIMLDYENQ